MPNNEYDYRHQISERLPTTSFALCEKQAVFPQKQVLIIEYCLDDFRNPFKKDFLFNTCRSLPEIQFRKQGS